jgi:hypothetical protein
MAVAVVDTGTAAYVASATTCNYTFTISGTATLAVAYIVQDATQSITSVTWDPTGANQPMTLVGSEPCPTATNGKVYIYALVSPTAGTSKTLRVINGTATGTSAELQTYSGTITSSVAAACTNALIANGTTAGAANFGTAAQSGTSGDMYVSAYVNNGSITSVSNTQIYLLAPAGNDAAGNRLASTGASVSLTALSGATNQWAAVSCDIKQSSGATTIWVPNTDPKHDVANSTHAKVAAVAVAAVYAFVPFNTPQINTQVDGWQQPLSTAVQSPKVQLGSSYVPFIPSQAPTTPTWGWQSATPATPAVAFVNAPNLPFIVPPFAIPSGWQSTSALAPPVAKPQFGYTFVPFNTPQTNTAFLGWYQALASTPPSPPAQQGFTSLSYNFVPPVNTIVGMGWYQALAPTPPAPPSQIGATFVPFNTPQITTVSPWGWYQPLSLAPAIAQAILPETAWVPGPFPTFTLAWQQPLASTPPPAQAQLGTTSLAYNIQPLANTVVGMPWQQPLSTPVPVAVAYQSQFFVPYNTTQTIVVTTLIQRTLTGVGL